MKKTQLTIEILQEEASKFAEMETAYYERAIVNSGVSAFAGIGSGGILLVIRQGLVGR
nr:hypothetical protein [Acidithiobacillus montserratensis]MBU2748815.1 hypothetical protein [Acidithiobacillus montserratensis]